jgi:protease I
MRQKGLVINIGLNIKKKDMELQGKKVMILVEELYNEFEFWYPYYHLKEAGAETVVVGSTGDLHYKSKIGLPCQADASADKVSAKDFNSVVIPGGYAPDHIRRHPEMVNLVRDFFEGGKVVAAICHAGWMLISANILSGRKVTPFFTIKEDLINAGAQ